MTSRNLKQFIAREPWLFSDGVVKTCKQIYTQSQKRFKTGGSIGQIKKIKTQQCEPVAKTSAGKNNLQTANGQQQRSKLNNNRGVVGGARTENSSAPYNGPLGSVIGRNGAVANLTAHRKLLKSSPNYKIYGSRRFGSSASSSKASLFRRYDDRRRVTQQSAHLYSRLCTFGNQPGGFGLNVGKNMSWVQARNQHMISRPVNVVAPEAQKLRVKLQNDLMPINSNLKDRIALGRVRLRKLAPKKTKATDPLYGWNHPPKPEMFSMHSKENVIAKAELQKQYKRMQVTTKQRQYRNLYQMEQRSAILGTVGKKAVHQQMDTGNKGANYEKVTKLVTPRNSPHAAAREVTRINSIRQSRKPQPPTSAKPKEDLATKKQLEEQFKTAVAESSALHLAALAAAAQRRKPEKCTTVIKTTPTPMQSVETVSPITSRKQHSKPIDMPLEKSEEKVARGKTFNKNSPTAVLVKGQNAANARRFNHSSYVGRVARR